ncbi:bidirectional sugar transporter SWEET5-like [Momordica charantia]|uniref:Bidirectional sugar transporter SWEET n=1 Tax=Momordica charantia TaxID=3673 RepID=A0A6J1D8L5_MOMCH|nr:bidirectional sugar transporter SWEET5-like [Momordica charantia]XP_022150123.1 bidirectional sugar transporter SWEET5-like [Momordica charantia]
MVSAAVARFIVGVIGNVISFGLFLSPLPTFFTIIKKKSVEEFKPDPYIATTLNCMFWVFYGMPFVHPNSFLVITINSVGLVLEMIYLTIFFFFADYKGRKKVCVSLLIELIFVSIVVHITILALRGTKSRSLMVGIICDIFNILMYISPLTIMKKVIQTKSVKYMPFTLSLANFFNGCVWTAYALIEFDIYILICNGIGVVSGLLQLFLYAYFSITGSKEEEIIEKEPKKIQLSTVEGPCKVVVEGPCKV